MLEGEIIMMKQCSEMVSLIALKADELKYKCQLF